MMARYIGFLVEVTSSIGKIVGTVASISSEKIDLTDAIINNTLPFVNSFTIRSDLIKDIRILSTNSQSGDTPKRKQTKDSKSIVNNSFDDCVLSTPNDSSRAQRRDWLRNIPNAYSAYVCPDSPPLINRTIGEPALSNYIVKNVNGLQQLDNALAKVTIKESSLQKHHNSCRHKRRSYSMSESAMKNQTDVSGTESDTFHPRYHNQVTNNNGNKNNNNNVVTNAGHFNAVRSSFRVNNHNNGHNHSNTNHGNNKLNLADWDRICVEEFIDEEFDFERNLALFNKSAFYEMVDLKQSNSPNGSGPNAVLSRLTTTTTKNSSIKSINKNMNDSKPTFDERPDGVGVPLLSGVFLKSTSISSQIVPNKKDQIHLYDNNVKNTKTVLPELISKKSKQIVANNTNQNLVVGRIDDDKTTFSSVNTNMTTVSDPCYPNPSIHLPHLSKHSYLYTKIGGYRVPIYSNEHRQYFWNYLTTNGLTWSRVIEMASRSMVDQLTTYLRQTNRTPQRISHRPPARILILLTGTHLGGAICLNLARNLSIRGSCVLLVCPTCTPDDNFPNNSDLHQNMTDLSSLNHHQTMSKIYRDELNLLIQFSPKPNQYGLEEDGADETLYWDEEELDLVEDYNDQTRKTLAHEQNENAIMWEYTSIGRMWMSRMPGLKILRRQTSIFKLPTHMRIDAVIIGHDNMMTMTPPTTTLPNDSMSQSSFVWPNINPCLSEWLQYQSKLNGLGLLIHLNPPCAPSFWSKLPRLSPNTNQWMVEFGLPICPHSFSSQLSDAINSDRGGCGSDDGVGENKCHGSNPATHYLIDIGLGRNMVRRLVGDLKCLPPYGLFDSGSVIELCQEPI